MLAVIRAAKRFLSKMNADRADYGLKNPLMFSSPVDVRACIWIHSCDLMQ